jgi:hypothetical protein
MDGTAVSTDNRPSVSKVMDEAIDLALRDALASLLLLACLVRGSIHSDDYDFFYASS